MTWVHDATTKNLRMEVLKDQIDSGGAAGSLELRDSGDNVLFTYTLTYPCGTVTADVLNLDVDPDIAGVFGTTGTIDKGVLKDSTGTIRSTTTSVSTSNADILVTKLLVESGDTSNLLTAAIQHG